AALIGSLIYGAYAIGLAFKAAGEAMKLRAENRKPLSQMTPPKSFRGSADGAPGSQGYQSSIDMISGSLDGKTQPQRDAEAAAAKAAAEKTAADQAKAAEAAKAAEQAKAI